MSHGSENLPEEVAEYYVKARKPQSQTRNSLS